MAYTDPERQAAYRARNREKIRERDRRWRQENREKVRERQRERRTARGLSEKDRAQRREYYLRNREKILERQRERNQETREYQSARLRRSRADEPEKYRARRMRRYHGMSPGDWAVMWAAQDGRCYLCGEELAVDTAVIEHDHRCCPRNYSCPICRRGLACGSCNSAIGWAFDDAARLRRMADALEAAQAIVEQRMIDAGQELTLFAVTGLHVPPP